MAAREAGPAPEPEPGRASAADVARACASWIFIPPEADRVETGEYLVLSYPLWYEHPLQLVGLLPERPVADVVAEVLQRSRAAVGLGRPEILCWVRPGAPAGLEDVLRGHGGRVVETLDVLARPLAAEAAASETGPAGLELRWSDDFATFRDAVRLGTEVFGGYLPDPDALRPLFEEERSKLAAGGGGSVVAYLDGHAVGTGGVTVAGPDARLWGGAVLPAARRRGVHRTLLDARLDHAVARGARLALVKARVETSAPLLRRAGFHGYGRERSFLVPLGDAGEIGGISGVTADGSGPPGP